MLRDCVIYVDGDRWPGESSLADARAEAIRNKGFVWLDLHDPGRQEFDEVAQAFALHHLVVDAATQAHQRPKIEQHGDALLVVLKAARYVDSEEVVELSELVIVAGSDYVVTVQRGPACDVATVHKELEQHRGLLPHGPAAAVYGILDHIVDDYAPVIEGIDHDIQELEEQVFSPNRHMPIERIYLLKREVLQFHQATASLEEPLDQLSRGRMSPWTDDLQPYFRDAHDHLSKVMGRVDAFSDLLTSVLHAALAQVGIRQNEDMRRISAWVAIAAVPTLVAGLYGMNFEHMPELEWRFGYPLVVGIIATVCVALYRNFRRNGWL